MTDCHSSQIERRYEFATKIARQAGDLTLGLFRTNRLEIEHKADGTPVTVADRQAEQLLREQIAREFPDDALLGEEFGESPGSSGFQWILDPIDGTKSFVSGVPLYTTLVAVLFEKNPQIGVIYAPAAGEMVHAQVGKGCWHVVSSEEAQPARVSAVNKLSEAVFVTTEVRSFTAERKTDARNVYDRLEAECRVTRTWGDGFGYLLVATGRAEVMIDPCLSVWDAAAMQPVIEEAGGRFFDWQGRPSIDHGDAVATNAPLAESVLAILYESSC